MLSIGLMSGTSMDGIDAALIKTDGYANVSELGQTSLTYEPAFTLLLKATEHAIKKTAEKIISRSEALAQAGNKNATEEIILKQASNEFVSLLSEYLQLALSLKNEDIPAKLQELSHYLYHDPYHPLHLLDIIQHSTELHANLVLQLLSQSAYQANQIDIIGCHGQAFFHRPSEKLSIILCNAQYLADKLGIAVISDFRRNDVAAGGQGAPFAPLYHQALAIRDNKIPCAVVNCGGIANITLINNKQPENLIGFDTGPGNGLIDKLVRQRTQGEQQMDKNGQYGSQGQVNQIALTALYDHAIRRKEINYFTVVPPKSLDIGDMKLIPALDTLSLPDACRTLAAFTADTIVNSLSLVKMTDTFPLYWILAGGGWNNPIILQELKTRLVAKLGKNVAIETANETGWNNQGLEAQIFAYLAVRSWLNLPLSVPGTTNVPQPLCGGIKYEPKEKA